MTDTKVCSRCKTELPLDQFHNYHAGKFGKSGACKICATLNTMKGKKSLTEKSKNKIELYEKIVADRKDVASGAVVKKPKKTRPVRPDIEIKEPEIKQDPGIFIPELETETVFTFVNIKIPKQNALIIADIAKQNGVKQTVAYQAVIEFFVQAWDSLPDTVLKKMILAKSYKTEFQRYVKYVVNQECSPLMEKIGKSLQEAVELMRGEDG